MNRLIHCHPSVLRDPENHGIPGVRALSYFAVLFSTPSGNTLIDRTHTIRTPIATRSLFPIPAFRHSTKTYEEICNERAMELLGRAAGANTPLYTFWSGGIDSTLVLVSLLKNATPEQKKNITVLMTDDSIAENPNFYKDHVYGKLRTDSSVMFPYLLGDPVLITNGEQNDQLFGLGVIKVFVKMFGMESMHAPYEKGKLFAFFNDLAHDEAIANLYIDLFDRLMQSAPVSISTHFHYFWWINFALKWQETYLRMISATPRSKTKRITLDYLSTWYAPFYSTEDFQLWSMNNLDKRIKDTWKTYKWPAKEIIYHFTKDAEYRDNKTKSASLPNIMKQHRRFIAIDEGMQFYDTINLREFLDSEHDFVLS